jgi:hypothetical protein
MTSNWSALLVNQIYPRLSLNGTLALVKASAYDLIRHNQTYKNIKKSSKYNITHIYRAMISCWLLFL